MSTSSPYRPDIDGLRAFAVMSVVLYHAFPALLPGGFVGVDVFFVISGFLITRIIATEAAAGTFSYRVFYARRIRRIFPALLLVCSFCAISGYFLLLPHEYADFGKHLAASSIFSVNFVFWQEANYFDAPSDFKMLLHLWSLAIEEQFYLLFPVLLLFAGKRMGMAKTVLWLAIFSFLANVLLVQMHPTSSFFNPLTRFWELLAGSVLALHPQRLTRLTFLQSKGLALAGILQLLMAVTLINEERAFPGWWALLPVGGAAAMIAAGKETAFNRMLMGNRVAVFIGLISYPLYLWHWPLLAMGKMLYAGEAPVTLRLGLIALSLLLAWLTWRLVERPIRYHASRRVVPLLIGGMAALGIAGLGLMISKGLPFRFPPEELALADTRFDAEATQLRECFFSDQAIDDALVRRCLGENIDILVLGDSYAAHLYPGFDRMAQQHGVKVRQFNEAFCPPLLGIDVPRNRNCKANNARIFEIVASVKPKLVVLAANWSSHLDKNARLGEHGELFSHTAEFLTKAGISQVVVMGETPGWMIEQPKVSLMLRRAGNFGERTSLFLNPRNDFYEQWIKQRADEMGATFISLKALLCNAQGCLIALGQNLNTPVIRDRGHFTREGSEYVVERIFNRLPLTAPPRKLKIDPEKNTAYEQMADISGYVLALSWSPAYCADSQHKERDRLQCIERSYGFVVHGLWPEFGEENREFCPAPRLARDVMQRMLDIMPGEGLVQHQWKKHGSCSRYSPDEFFALTRKQFDALMIPESFKSLQKPAHLSPKAVEAAWIRANRSLHESMVDVVCRGGKLREVRVCYDAKLNPSACPDHKGGRRNSCRADSVVILPVR